MRVEVWDTAFVRARRRDLHPVLADVEGYAAWWPRAATAPSEHGTWLALRPPTLRARLAGRLQTVNVRIVKNRRDLGVSFAYSGTLEGSAEWYYLDEPAGVTVHYLAHVEVANRGWRRTLAEHRACVRAALHELKDRLEGHRIPGAEPDPRLLADQQEAIKAFQAGVEAWARKLAAERERAGTVEPTRMADGKRSVDGGIGDGAGVGAGGAGRRTGRDH